MSTSSNADLLFRIWPYAAVVIWGGGLVLRYLRALPKMDAVSAGLSESWSTFGSSKILRLALGVVALGHLVALVWPSAILSWNGGASDRLYLLEGTGLVFGLVALVSWGLLLLRHLDTQHPSLLGDLGDTVFVALVLVGLVSGLFTALVYRWASSWAAATVMPYTLSLLSGSPDVGYVAPLPLAVRIHVVSGFGVLAAFPFTRLAPFLVVALHRVFGVIRRPMATAGRLTEDFLRRHNPAVWIWPKED
jgi:nitrate reductase gamma subunit